MNNTRRFSKKSGRRVSLVIFAGILVLLLGIFLWWQYTLSPVNASDNSTKVFTIEKGESIPTIASNLYTQGLIRNIFTFELLLKQEGLGERIQAGDFHLSPSMNADTIAHALQNGSRADVKITIPEGKRAEEIADILQSKLPSFQESWREQLDTNEGYLFPDTYYFTRDMSITDIIQTMRSNFDQKYATIPSGTTTLSQQDIVIIASIVEREAKFPEDRPLVASVIINRLKIGMPLYIDATIQYALGYQPVEQTWWKKNLTESDLTLNSSYNTRLNAGLPPTPISNPGLAVLGSVIDAPHTNYFYYISDKSGHNHYARTLDEHNSNIRKYGL